MSCDIEFKIIVTLLLTIYPYTDILQLYAYAAVYTQLYSYTAIYTQLRIRRYTYSAIYMLSYAYTAIHIQLYTYLLPLFNSCFSFRSAMHADKY